MLRVLLCQIINLLLVSGAIVCLILGEGVCFRRRAVFPDFKEDNHTICIKPFPITEWSNQGFSSRSKRIVTGKGSSGTNPSFASYVVFACICMDDLLTFVAMVITLLSLAKRSTSLHLSSYNFRLSACATALVTCGTTIEIYANNNAILISYGISSDEAFFYFVIISWIIANAFLAVSMCVHLLQCFLVRIAYKPAVEDTEVEYQPEYGTTETTIDNSLNTTEAQYSSEQHYSQGQHYSSDQHYASDEHYKSSFLTTPAKNIERKSGKDNWKDNYSSYFI